MGEVEEEATMMAAVKVSSEHHSIRNLHCKRSNADFL